VHGLIDQGVTMKDFALYAIDVAAGLGATYADARVIDHQFQSIRTKDLTVADFSTGHSRGVGIRVLCGGWGFASTRDLSHAGITRATKRALAAAKASGRCLSRPIVLAPEPAYQATWVSPHLIDPFTVSDEEKIAILHEAAKIMGSVKGVGLSRGEMIFIKE